MIIQGFNNPADDKIVVIEIAPNAHVRSMVDAICHAIDYYPARPNEGGAT